MRVLRLGQALNAINSGIGGSLEFIFSVNTATVGSTTSTQFQLPLVSSGTISMDVDWGDGNTDTITAYNQAETLHTYSVAGVYTIEISNEVRGFQFSSGSDRAKLNEISNWGGFNFTKNSSFDECVNMTCTANDTPTIETTNCAYQFLNCTNFNGSVNNWGMSSVTNVQSMFFGCTNFNQPINNWETSSFIDMQNMFQGCSSFDQDVSYWDIRNSTNMFNFMLGVTLSTANYDALLVSWEEQRGSELVVNGDFITDSDWTKGTGWSINTITNKAECDGTQSSTSDLQTLATLNINTGEYFEVTFDAVVTSGQIDMVTLIGTGGAEIQNITVSGSYSVFSYGASTGDNSLTVRADSSFVGSITNISVKRTASAGLTPNFGSSTYTASPNVSGVAHDSLTTATPTGFGWTITDGGTA